MPRLPRTEFHAENTSQVFTNMSKSSSVSPTEPVWKRAAVNSSRKDNLGRNLYWFTGVPEDARLGGIRSDQRELEAENLLTAKTIVTGFVDFTTSHGITHVYKTKGLLKKIVWGILSLAALAVLIGHAYIVLNGYLQFETTTNIEIQVERSLQFPAVTICNSNPIMQSAIPNNLWKIISDKRGSVLNGTDSTSNQDIIKRLKEEVSYFSDVAKTALGYQLEDFIIYCTYDGSVCRFNTDFVQFYDSHFGNCYTFNSGKVPGYDLKYSYTPGYLYGLSLVINLGVYEYLPYLAEDSGVQIVVHNQTDMPFPGYAGVTAGPGLATNLGIKQSVITRISGKPRYGVCTTTDAKSALYNAYADKYHVEYTQLACLKTCYQQEVVSKCSCFDAEYPYNSTWTAFSDYPATDKPCRSQNAAEAACVASVESEFFAGTLGCGNCTRLCNETRYDVQRSTQIFPSPVYIDDFIERLNLTHPSIVSKLESKYNSFYTAVSANFLKINIYFEHLEYTQYTEAVSYDDYQFASDLGGVFGLWIGWSVLTIFEFFDLLFDLIGYSCYKSCAKTN